MVMSLKGCRALGMGICGLMLAMALVPVAHADEASAWEQRLDALLARTDQRLNLTTNRSEVMEGEALHIQVVVPWPGRLNLIQIGPDGQGTVLFPNAHTPDNRVTQGAFSFPGSGAPFKLQAASPFGRTRLIAFLTRDKLNLYSSATGPEQPQFASITDEKLALIDRILGRTKRPTPAKFADSAYGSTWVWTCERGGTCSPTSSEVAAPQPVERRKQAFAPGILLEPEDKAIMNQREPLKALSASGLQLTKNAEGFVNHLYEDAAGYCTIAYGHLLRLDACSADDQRQYVRGITEPDGEKLLRSDMARAQRAVMNLVKVTLTDGQYAALCDFTYNVGAGNLKGSKLLQAINAGEHHRVPSQLKRWVRAGGRVLQGLVKRREAEIKLYFEGKAIPKQLLEREDTSPVDIRRGESAGQEGAAP